jgi:hypothetical protein
VVLPCPECRERGIGGGAKIGNNRHECATCNRFVQQVRRSTWAMLKQHHEAEYASLRLEVERELYPRVMTSYLAGRA